MIQFDRRSFQVFDYLLLFDLALLLGFGVLLVASASNEGHFQRQIVWATAAIVLALAVAAVAPAQCAPAARRRAAPARTRARR